MRNGVLALAVSLVVLCAVAAGPAGAATRPIVGIGDQKTQMFDDPRFQWLGIKHARLVVPWYVALNKNPGERAYVDNWIAQARRTRVQPLVGFGHGYSPKLRRYLPKVAEFRRAVRAFRKRYPQVRTFIAWNEGNHCSQPTCNRPEQAGRYYNTIKALCKGCTVTAPAVLDQPNMVRWLKRFRKTAKGEPRIYALHNYLDVNRLRSKGTRRMLRAVPKNARIWIAETGGVVKRKHFRNKASFPESPEHAGKVTTYALRLGRKYRQIERIYIYHWNMTGYDVNWDSGLIDQLGAGRPGFDSLARFLGRDPAKAPNPPAPPPPPTSEPPIAENPPAQSEPQPSSGGSSGGSGEQQQQQPPPPPPPEQECSLANLCIDPLGGV